MARQCWFFVCVKLSRFFSVVLNSGNGICNGTQSAFERVRVHFARNDNAKYMLRSVRLCCGHVYCVWVSSDDVPPHLRIDSSHKDTKWSEQTNACADSLPNPGSILLLYASVHWRNGCAVHNTMRACLCIRNQTIRTNAQTHMRKHQSDRTALGAHVRGANKRARANYKPRT